tara:strand:- start:504 stop:1550 length:1047 start_codon:yes stop_codon:yes gene_type:complete
MVKKTDTILEGRVSYDELPFLTKEVFRNSFFKGSEGVLLIDRKYIRFSDIYWGSTEKNPMRVKGSSPSNINNLATSRKQGIDVEAPRPVVAECDITSASGDVYHYQAENGITRKKADFENSQQDGGDWYDVVSYHDTEGHTAGYNREVFLQLQNDDLPQLVHDEDDLEASVSRLLQSGDIVKEKGAITAFVFEAAPNISTNKRNEVIRRSINNNDVPTKTITWRDGECKTWYSEECIDADDTKVDYFFATHYFQDRIYPVLKQFAETEEVQVISEHIQPKGDSIKDVHRLRDLSDDKWEECRQILEEVSHYMYANDFELPVKRGLWQPQIKDGDDKEDDNHFVVRKPK